MCLERDAINCSADAGWKYINVMAAVSDDDEIHEVHLDITNKVFGEVTNSHYHPDTKTFNINEHIPAASVQPYQLKVEPDDHSGNGGEKESDINLQ